MHFTSATESNNRKNENKKIRVAIIAAHGKPGNAAAVFSAVCGSLNCFQNNMIAIVAPYFGGAGKDKSPKPKTSQNNETTLLSWEDNKDWISATMEGKTEDGLPLPMSSFEALNELIQKTVETFPELNHLTLAGFSAGGQMIQHFATYNSLDQSLINSLGKKIKVTFLVGSPSSYLYFNDSRIKTNTPCDTPNCKLEKNNFTNRINEMANADSGNCKIYNKYKYGLENLPKNFPNEKKALENYLENTVYYLVNTGDASESPKTYTGKESKPTAFCSDNTQGPKNNSMRMQRGLVYINHLYNFFPKSKGKHSLYVLDGASIQCEHNEFCVYHSDIAKKLLMGSN